MQDDVERVELSGGLGTFRLSARRDTRAAVDRAAFAQGRAPPGVPEDFLVETETTDFEQVYPRFEPSRPARPSYWEVLPWGASDAGRR